MVQHRVSVSQLNGIRYDKGVTPFLNVIEDVYKAIGVWGNFHRLPTYLCIRNCDFFLMQFTDDEEANFWLSSNCLKENGWATHKLEENKNGS